MVELFMFQGFRFGWRYEIPRFAPLARDGDTRHNYTALRLALMLP